MSTMPAGGLKQLALFRPPLPPTRQGGEIEVQALSLAARTYTGDFYFTHRSGERFWFAQGDVAGKGLGAAVIMAMIQEELEQRITSCAQTECDPSVTMMRLHTFLKSILPSNKFASAAIGYIHDNGTLVVVNAGHCPLIVMRRDGSIEEIGSTGPVIGLLSTPQWHTFSTHLRRGESVVLYSDGLMEAQSSAGEEFGLCGVREVLQNAARAGVLDLTSALLTAVERHSAGARDDDMTVLVMRRER